MSNYALYYPSIEFQDYEWLWGASLLWDRIYKIVPDGYKPDEPNNIKILEESGEIGITINPLGYAKEIANQFIEKLETLTWDAAALSDSDDFNSRDYLKLHKDKIDVKLREMLIAKGQASASRDWLSIPTEFSAHYMTYLANKIAERNGLQLVTDYSSAWTCSNYFRFDGEVEPFPFEDSNQQLAILVIRDFLPKNITSITANEIISFREKRRDQRQRFFNNIKKAAKEISDCKDPLIIKDMIHDLKIDIEASLKEYRTSADILKVSGWTGIKSISFPIATDVLSKIIPLDPESLTILSSIGIGLGIINGFRDYRSKKNKLSKECDYSYLIELRRNWKNMYQGSDYNYYLCRQMEEFIND